MRCIIIAASIFAAVCATNHREKLSLLQVRASVYDEQDEENAEDIEDTETEGNDETSRSLLSGDAMLSHGNHRRRHTDHHAGNGPHADRRHLPPPPTTAPHKVKRGCMDPHATNYDPDATQKGAGSKKCFFGPERPDRMYRYSKEQRMSPEDSLVMYRIGHVLFRLLDSFNVIWWVTDGSLLGAVRNGGIIPHDDDIDINILLPQRDVLKTDAFSQALHLNGLSLMQTSMDRIYVWNRTELDRAGGNYPNERGTKMKVDIWPLRHSGNEWHQLEETKHAFPGDLCTPDASSPSKYSCKLLKVPFGEDVVWTPYLSTSKSYLLARYGASWDSMPECVGSEHGCHLVENVTHDLQGHAQPAGPLLEPEADSNGQSGDDMSQFAGQLDDAAIAGILARGVEDVD